MIVTPAKISVEQRPRPGQFSYIQGGPKRWLLTPPKKSVNQRKAKFWSIKSYKGPEMARNTWDWRPWLALGLVIVFATLFLARWQLH